MTSNDDLRALIMALGDRLLACAEVLGKLAERKEMRNIENKRQGTKIDEPEQAMVTLDGFSTNG